MANRCTTLLWITRRHRVCSDGTVERRLSKAKATRGGGDSGEAEAGTQI